jgi:hypothetical protein
MAVDNMSARANGMSSFSPKVLYILYTSSSQQAQALESVAIAIALGSFSFVIEVSLQRKICGQFDK